MKEKHFAGPNENTMLTRGAKVHRLSQFINMTPHIKCSIADLFKF